jgi:hypothetical protein
MKKRVLIYDQENGITKTDNGNEFNETLITGFYNVNPELLYERKSGSHSNR